MYFECVFFYDDDDDGSSYNWLLLRVTAFVCCNSPCKLNDSSGDNATKSLSQAKPYEISKNCR